MSFLRRASILFISHQICVVASISRSRIYSVFSPLSAPTDPMRPEILFSLFKPITSLKGVGPRIATLIEKIAGSQIVDLCWHLPFALIDRRYAPKIVDAQPGVIATLTVTVLAHKKPANRRMPYKVTCGDDNGKIDLVFFEVQVVEDAELKLEYLS